MKAETTKLATSKTRPAEKPAARSAPADPAGLGGTSGTAAGKKKRKRKSAVRRGIGKNGVSRWAVSLANAINGNGTSTSSTVIQAFTNGNTLATETAEVIDEIVSAEGPAATNGYDLLPEKPRKKKVKFRSVVPREEATAYFKAIVAGLERGSIQLRQDEETLTLSPAAQLSVTVKAATKDQNERLAFEISWRSASDGELSISSD